MPREREREEKGPAGCDPADVHRHAAQTSRYIENPMIPFPSQSEHKKQHAIDPRCTQSRPAGVPSASRTLRPTTLSSRWPQAVRTRKICKIRVKPRARRCARGDARAPRACAPRAARAARTRRVVIVSMHATIIQLCSSCKFSTAVKPRILNRPLFVPS